MFYFIGVQKLVYLRHWNGDIKLKFNEFIASVEYSNTTDAGLSYDLCVFKKNSIYILNSLRQAFVCLKVILEKSLYQ